ncbi:MAG: transcriptional regulator NrdR [Planctomycetota bacterium]|nr:transcriptional regulator NrdR [Planctomycetota bacterium]
MRCPFCKMDNDKVIDTRLSDAGLVIRRRRECLTCGKRFTTHERLEEMPIRVIKKTGRREPFERGKILSGVLRAVEKRPLSMERAEELVDALERELLDGAEREISTQRIGGMVMARLRAMDEVAYVRFASVYREYQALDEFIQEIQKISDGDNGKNAEAAAPGDGGSAADNGQI